MSAPRVLRAEVHELRDRLSDRDLAIVGQVAELRLMSGRQIETVFFRQSFTRRTRPRPGSAVGYWRAWSASVCWFGSIDGSGREGGLACIRLRARADWAPPSTRRRLAASDLRTGAGFHRSPDRRHTARCRRHPRQPSWSVRTADRSRRARLLANNARVRPPRPTPRPVRRPRRGELEYRWFVEVDRSTHHAPSLLVKAQLYERYYRSGVEQAAHDVFPRVLWIAPDSARAERIRGTFSGGEFSSGLMLATTTDRAVDVLTGGEA